LTFKKFYSTQQRKSKIYSSADEAIHDINDGSKLLVGGFGLCGIPENLIAALKKKGCQDLIVVSNTAGEGFYAKNSFISTR
jgi:3-oxoacid CoA-transferase